MNYKIENWQATPCEIGLVCNLGVTGPYGKMRWTLHPLPSEEWPKSIWWKGACRVLARP